jgi:hypothetical protein
MDPDLQDFFRGFAAEVEARRAASIARVAPPRRRAIVGVDDAPAAPPRPAPSAPAPQHAPSPHAPAAALPWNLIVCLGVGVGLALGIAISSLARRHKCATLTRSKSPPISSACGR